MNVVVIVGLSVLFISGGHCQPVMTSSALLGALEEVQFLTTNAMNKRQITPAIATCVPNLQDFRTNYPQDCATELTTVLTGIQTLNISAITAAYRVVCEPRCGNPAIGFYNQCNASQDVINRLRGLCTRNNAGRLCYEQMSSMCTDITQAGFDCAPTDSNCTTACQNALITFGNNSGCCINTLNITALSRRFPFTVLQNSLWSRCGVDTPGFCNLEASTLSSTVAPTTQSSAKAPKFVKALFLLALIVMAMLLPVYL